MGIVIPSKRESDLAEGGHESISRPATAKMGRRQLMQRKVKDRGMSCQLLDAAMREITLNLRRNYHLLLLLLNLMAKTTTTEGVF